MKLFSIAVVAAFLFSCTTNKYVTRSSDFETRVVRHQTVAVLPVNIVQPNEKLSGEAETYGYSFQQRLHLQLNAAGKNTEGHTITFQPLEKTNEVLKQNNLAIQQAYMRQPDALAKLLGVDVVLMVTITDKGNFTQSEAFGISGGRSVYNSSGANPNARKLEINPSHVDMSANLYDAADGKLIWRTWIKGGTHLPSTMEALGQYISDWIANRLPYKT